MDEKSWVYTLGSCWDIIAQHSLLLFFFLKKCVSFLLWLCWNKFHKFSALKEHKFILLYFYRSEFQNGLMVLKSRCPKGCISFGGCRTEIVPCLWQLIKASHIPWFTALSIFKTSTPISASIIFLWFCLSCLPLSLIRTLWLHWAHPVKPG